MAKKDSSQVAELDDWSVNLEDAFEIGAPPPPDTTSRPRPSKPKQKKPKQKNNEPQEEMYFSCSSGNNEDTDSDDDSDENGPIAASLEEALKKQFQGTFAKGMAEQMNTQAMFGGNVNTLALDLTQKRNEKLKQWMTDNRSKLNAQEVKIYEDMIKLYSDMAEVYKKHPNDTERAQVEVKELYDQVNEMPVKYPHELEVQFQAEATSNLFSGMMQGLGEGLSQGLQQSADKQECCVM